MSTMEAIEQVSRCLDIFPTLADEHSRQGMLQREFEKYSKSAVRQAIDEYLHLGEKFLNPTQLVAIAYRIDRQEREREDSAVKKIRAQTERGSTARHQSRLCEADKIIAEMTDEDVLREWTPMLNGMSGKPREWAEKWPLAKVRTNMFLRTKIAELLTK